MSYRHCIVWLDHLRAVIISFSDDHSVKIELTSESEETQLHRKSGRPGSGRLADDHAFFERMGLQIETARSSQ